MSMVEDGKQVFDSLNGYFQLEARGEADGYLLFLLQFSGVLEDTSDGKIMHVPCGAVEALGRSVDVTVCMLNNLRKLNGQPGFGTNALPPDLKEKAPALAAYLMTVSDAKPEGVTFVFEENTPG